MPTVFLTGASGYVGGQVLKELTSSHPTIGITALVRDSQVAEDISKLYPAIQVVVGGLDDAELIAQEASKASIVVNAASNKHLNGAKAIHNGLSKLNSPAYWIQISGASLLAAEALASPTYDVGLDSSKFYDDLDGAEEIRSLIRAYPTREIDNYLLNASQDSPHLKTALVFPPIIYGKGEGPRNQRSVQIPALSRVTLEKGHVVRAGKGLNRWGSVQIADVARLFTGLVAEAFKGNEDASLWNENGLYLANAGEMRFAEISDRVSDAARSQGLIQSDEVQELSKAESDRLLPAGSVLFGSNARGVSKRAEALFGWKPMGGSLKEEIPRAVADEAP